mgnify:CR=1 FL=1|jgi:predicted transcriptional regulator
MKNSIKRLSDNELEVMKVIWNNKTPISTVDIKNILSESRQWNLSALQTTLIRLTDKGFLNTTKDSKNRYYTAIVEKKNYVEEQNKIFLKKLNNNSIKNFIASLYDSGTVSAEDLEEIKRFIDDKMKGE